MYELLMLITNSEIAGLQTYADAVRAEYASHNGGERPGMRFIENGEVLEIRFERFVFYVMYSCAARVKEQSSDIAARFALDHPEKEAIARASCRYELNSATSDPNMDYFNDMLFLSHAGTALKGVYVFDPGTEQFY